jgi:hypothetical protein
VTADGLSLGDGQFLKLGESGDLKIWHDGMNSYIKDHDAGNLFIQGSTTVTIEDVSGNNMAVFNDGASVDLYYGATSRFSTTNSGIDVTGDLNIGDATPQILMTDSDTSSTFKIALDGVSTNVTNSGTSGELAFHTFDGEKLRLKTGGINVTGSVTTTSGSPEISLVNNTATTGKTFKFRSLSQGEFDLLDPTGYSAIGVNNIGCVGIHGRPAYNAAGIGIDLFSDSTTGATLGTRIQNNGSGRLLDVNNSSGNKLTVLNNGNVGIGTSSPNTKLQVNSTSSVTTLFHRPDNTNFAPHGIAFSTRNDSTDGGLGDARSGLFSYYNGDIFLSASSGTNISSDPLGWSRLFIEGSNGNVGIGTTSPSHPLQFGGTAN